VERTIAEGLTQTPGYMDRCGAEAGHLMVFDRAPEPCGACEGGDHRIESTPNTTGTFPHGLPDSTQT